MATFRRDRCRILVLVTQVSGGGGGGGDTYPEVSNFAALPAAGSHSGEIYAVLAAQGVYFVNRRPAGYYLSNGSAWTYLGDLSDPYFNDGYLTFSDDGDPTKKLMFQLDQISAATTRLVTWPDKDGVVAMTDDPLAAHAGEHVTGGGDKIRDASASQDGLATAAQIAKLDGIAAGATAGATWGTNVSGQPSVVGQAEAEAGTATTERIWTAQRVAQAIAALAGGGSGGTKTYAVFTPRDNQPPASNFATLDTRNSIELLDFDDTTEESAIFRRTIPEAAVLGSGLKVRILWAATSATTGDVRWGAQFQRLNTDIDSDSFDTATEGTTTTDGTSGVPVVTELTVTNIDGLTAGDGYRLRVYRDTSDGADTMVGDAEILGIEVRSAA